jgi:hypothetical protein
MNHSSGAPLAGFDHPAHGFSAFSTASKRSRLGWCGLILSSAMTVSFPALAQQKTGPGLTGDDSLTWNGITLYGVIDIGYQFDTHSAPFTPYRPSASGNIVR